MRKLLSIIQGSISHLAGVWAIANVRTFEMVPGPKTDLLLVTIGGVLIAGLRGNVSLEIFLLATGTAFTLTSSM